MARREQLIDVFADTRRFYQENKVLAEAIEYTCERTKLYEAEDYPDLPDSKHEQSASIRISKGKTFQTAMHLREEHPDQKIAVLNFASATKPGGGVLSGSSAQEESLCRCSTLYPSLDRPWLWTKYYEVNRAAKNVLHTDACIYSPKVIICKTDESVPKRMAPEAFVTVDVITCAAPNLRKMPGNYHNPEMGHPVIVTPEELYEIHLRRARHILHVAATNSVNAIVLGAFGCGAFSNDPNVVARAYHAAVEDYKDRFSEIEFAIYCKDYETENYKVFHNEFG